MMGVPANLRLHQAATAAQQPGGGPGTGLGPAQREALLPQLRTLDVVWSLDNPEDIGANDRSSQSDDRHERKHHRIQERSQMCMHAGGQPQQQLLP